MKKITLMKIKNVATYAKKKFTEDNNKVRDHCRCNMNYKK